MIVKADAEKEEKEKVKSYALKINILNLLYL